MSARVELHFHALPSVDDGPANLTEAIALAQAAVDDGTDTIIATPHVRDVFISELPARVADLNSALDRAAIEVEVKVGGEFGVDDIERLCAQEVDLLAQGADGDRWVLLEAPFSGRPTTFEAVAAKLRRWGYGVVIAHPERSRIGGVELWMEEVERGSVLQVNAGSVLGRYGDAVEERAVDLIESDLVAAIASDAHGAHQPPALTPALSALSALVGEGRASRLVNDGPRSLLAGFGAASRESSS